MNTLNKSATQLAKQRLSDGCDTMRKRLHGLLDDKGRVAEEVHAIRKLGKSLRGGFSLFQLAKSSSLEIQAIGRLLSGPRDAVSRLKTWNKLGWVGDAKISAAILGLLDQQTHSASRRPPPEAIAWCRDRVDVAQKQLMDLPTGKLPEKIRKGLEKLERRVFKRCGKLKNGAETHFHELRKALKAWLGAVEFLPEGLVQTNPQFNDLAECLGDENDLATLSVWLEAHGFTPRFAPDLWKSLNASRRKLQREVIKEVANLGRPTA